MSNTVVRLAHQFRSVLMSEGATGTISKVNRYIGNVLFEGFYDGPLVNCILSLARRYPVFLDIGAHTGSITLSVAQAFQQCVAIEPYPADVVSLRKAISSRGLSNCEVVECALGDVPGIRSLGMANESSGDRSLASRPDLPDHVSVLVHTLDLICGSLNIRRPFLIKLDVQGYEPLVCKGGRNFLRRECAIISEFWPWGIKSSGSDPLAYIRFLADLGFSARNTKNASLDYKVITRLAQYGLRDRYVTTDLLFVR